ncbi:MAG TPA: DnaJ C-terminal domain-containing protein [Patescibacteria group bacterium]|nr:DnaJ C-terminal domain-containing protein [Patescibacteria group bacterium]
MPSSKDYYEILGVSKNATDDQIKQAYRRLAREHHPDVVKDGDKSSAEARFKEINEAYQVLSDSQKRKMYDQFGQAGFGGGQNGQGGFSGFGGFGSQQGQWGPFTYSYTTSGSPGSGAGASPFEDFDPFDVFEQFFGFRGFGGSGAGRAPKRGKNLYYEMEISFGDAVRGIEKEIRVESGSLKIKIPAGVNNGTEIKYPGKGMAGPNNAPSGDLFLTIKVSTPKEFQRFGENLAISIEIDFIQAILGDTVEVPVVDSEQRFGVGKAELKIPAGTKPGSQIRMKGKGMPRIRDGGRGDVVVQILVGIPSKLNRRQRELLEEFKKS